MRLKKFSAVLFIILLLVSSSYADDNDIYDSVPTFSPYYSGYVKSSVLNEALRELNYIRWLIGVPNNVTLNSEMTRKAQHGAVLLDAIDTLTHTPGKPTDMDTSFYDLGYDATSHGNIAVSKLYTYSQYGTQVSGNMTLSYSTKMYMDDSDSYNLPNLGHRRWLMNPRMTQTGFGISTRRGYAVTYVIDESNSSSSWPISDEYITWPVNKHPHPLTYFNTLDDPTAWSVTLNSGVFNTVSAGSVTVRLTRQSDGSTWNFGSSGNGGYFRVTDNTVAGDQCIIFRPNNVSSYNSGETWQVYVSGLSRKDGTSGNISYSVTFTNTTTGYEENNTPTTNNNNNNNGNNTNTNTNNNNNGSGGGSGGGCSGLGVMAVIPALIAALLRRKSSR